MELLYLFVDKFNNINKQEFNFSSVIRFSFDVESKKLDIIKDERNKINLSNFFNKTDKKNNMTISNISAIIGKNGTGKTNVFRCLENIFSGEKSKVILVFEDNKELFCYENIEITLTNKDIIHNRHDFNEFISKYHFTYHSQFFYPYKKEVNMVKDIKEINKINDNSDVVLKFNCQIDEKYNKILCKNHSPFCDYRICNDCYNNNSLEKYINSSKFNQMLKFIEEVQKGFGIEYFGDIEKEISIKLLTDAFLNIDVVNDENLNILLFEFYTRIIPEFKKGINYWKNEIDNAKNTNSNKIKNSIQLFLNELNLFYAILNEFLMNLENNIKEFSKSNSQITEKDIFNNMNIKFINMTNFLKEANNFNKLLDDIYNDLGDLLKEIKNIGNIKLKVDLVLNKQYKQMITQIKNYFNQNNFKNYDKIKDLVSDKKLIVENNYFFTKNNYFDKVSELLNMDEFIVNTSSNYFLFSTLLLNIKESIKACLYAKKQNLLLFIDDVEISFHPELQRTFINDVIKYISKENPMNNLKIQLIISTHSPIIITDLPSDNIIFLDKDEKHNCIVQRTQTKTFGANIYQLFKDAFFMSEIVGEFAKEKINNIIEILSKNKLTEEDKEQVNLIIGIIGEPVMQKILKDMLEAKNDEN